MNYRAFVSSTYLDLKEHRAHVINALHKAGFFVDPMEFWTADINEPKVFSQKRVDGCDLCILLVAFRRGHVPKGETKSITQLEYEAAKKAAIDVLAFILDDDAPWPRKFDEIDSVTLFGGVTIHSIPSPTNKSCSQKPPNPAS
jgi:hypothetical protein